MGDLTPVLGIVCGMTSEVWALGHWANDPQIGIGISSARPDRAESEARRLVAQGCRLLLSWGVAGGLDPALVPGDQIIPGEVVTEDGESWPTPPPVLARLDRAIQTAKIPRPSRVIRETRAIVGLDRIVLTVEEKTVLFGRSGAVALDMESHRVARVAAEAGLPMLVVRAIGDPAGRALPALVARVLGEDGRPRITPVAAGLLRRPGDLATLLRVKRDTDAALASLAGIAGKVFPVVLEDAKGAV